MSELGSKDEFEDTDMLKVLYGKYILEVSDWNYQDKYYEIPFPLLRIFKEKILKDVSNIHDAWEWLIDQVDYGRPEDADLPIKTGRVDMSLPSFFFDYNAPESAAEWDI